MADETQDLFGSMSDDEQEQGVMGTEEDYDEQDEAPAAKRRKVGRAANPFLDVAAEDEDGGDDEEDEDDEEGVVVEGLIDDTEDVEGSAGKHRALEQAREQAELAALQAAVQPRYEEIGRRMQEEEEARALRRLEAAATGKMTRLDRQALQPSHKDPKLWIVGCKRGQERMLVVALMNKFVYKTERGMRMGITSAIARDNARGYIYVEARREDTVKAAISGLRNAFGSKVRLLPMKEMVDVLAVASQGPDLKEGTWVRGKRGLYQGDIGQVAMVESSGTHVVVKFVPRFRPDSDANESSSSGGGAEAGKKRKRRERPAARLFKASDYARGYEAERTGKFRGERVDDEGYLLKRVPVRSLDTTGVVPTLEEFKVYSNMGAGGVSDTSVASKAIVDALAATLPKAQRDAMNNAGGMGVGSRVELHKGDKIRIVAGELKSLTGTVLAVEGESVTFQPDDASFKESLTMLRSNCAKFFQIGDHVRVVRGLREGETGHIVHVDDMHAHVFSDTAQSEFKVFVKDVRLASSTMAPLDSLGEFEVYDLVELDSTSVGVIIGIDGTALRVLNQAGVVVTVTPQEVGMKRTRRAITLDSAGNNVAVNDVVRVLDGPYKDQQGTVKHIFRAHIFAHSRSVVENGGMFTLRGRSCILLGGTSGQERGSGPDFGAGGMRRGRRARDELLHKTVIIKSGTSKGYTGVVVGTTVNKVRVQLTSKPRAVSVLRSNVAQINEDGSEIGAMAFGGQGMLGSFASSQPLEDTSLSSAPKTPMAQFAPSTPMRSTGDEPAPMAGGSSGWAPAPMAAGGWGSAAGQPVAAAAPGSAWDAAAWGAAPAAGGAGAYGSAGVSGYGDAYAPAAAAAAAPAPASAAAPARTPLPGFVVQGALVTCATGQTAVVVETSVLGSADVRMLDTGHIDEVPGTSLSPVAPGPGDKAYAPSFGAQVLVKSIESGHAVVDLGGDIQMVAVADLVKVS